MKIGIPDYGLLNIPLAGLFQGMGFELVLPHSTRARYLELGSQSAPRDWSLPLKIQLGSYMAVLEAGAEVLLMTPGCSGCREDLNRQKQKDLLRQAGYDFLAVDFNFSWKGLLHVLGIIATYQNKLKFIKGMRLFWQKARLLSFLEENRLALGVNFTSFEREYYGQITDALRYGIFAEDFLELQWEAEALFDVVQGRHEPKPTCKIGIVGDLYSLAAIEPIFGVKNLLEERGVQVVQPLHQEQWLLGQLGLTTKMERSMQKKARWILGDQAGLADQESVWNQVGSLVQCSQVKCSGVIQLVSCAYAGPSAEQMVAVAKELGVPLFQLNLEEVTEMEQVAVKIKAFISLLNVERKLEENLNSVITL